jgi:Rieske Fe-S protein
MADERPRWREDFPVRGRQLHDAAGTGEVFTLGSGPLASVNVPIVDRPADRAPAPPRGESLPPTVVAPGGSLLFRYPTDDDPCILVRDAAGRIDAFSQVCTHLSCAVVHRPGDDVLACPCHKGSFSTREGLPLAGPPTRRLPRIVIEQRGADLVATAIEV